MKIITEQASGGDWKAYFEGEPTSRRFGASVYEALGALIHAWPERFGIEKIAEVLPLWPAPI